jgi:hypothetical protein
MQFNLYPHSLTEAEFSDVIGTKVFRVFLLAIHSHYTNGFHTPPPHPLEQKWFESGLQYKH